MEDLRAELEQSVDEAEWDWLVPHAARNAVVIVKPELNLVDVGMAIASDDAISVAAWIQQNLIYKPDARQLQEWEVDRSRRFNALILQPYVLVQDLAA